MTDAMEGLDRRALLRSAALAGTGALVGSALAPGLPFAAAQGGDPAPDPIDQTTGPQFFDDAAMNFGVLTALGGIAGGTAEFGEMMSTIARIQARGSTYPAYVEEFVQTARIVAGWADGARRRGHRVTERETSLRAAEYYALALFFALAMPNPRRYELQMYRRSAAHFDRAMRLMDPPAERIRIPYGRTHMPGWFLRPPGRRRKRPTIIFNNGSDGQNSELWAFGPLAALERGYNVLLFYGPGQGEMLFVRKIYFRPDWEKVVTPVVDFVRARDDVDRKRVAIWGWSFAGYLVPRAMAFEHRLAAAVTDPGAINYVDSWPKEVLATAYDGTKAEVDAGWDAFLADSPKDLQVTLLKRLEIFPTTSWYDAVRIMQTYNAKPVLHRITTPYLLTEPQLEQFYPGQSKLIYDGLTHVKDKRLVNFTAKMGAQYHCEPMAPQRRNEVILDWLAGRIGG